MDFPISLQIEFQKTVIKERGDSKQQGHNFEAIAFSGVLGEWECPIVEKAGLTRAPFVRARVRHCETDINY